MIVVFCNELQPICKGGQTMKETIAEFKKSKEFLVCVDSDGCAMDTMEVKHRKCFGPKAIEIWELQGVEKKFLENKIAGLKILKMKGLGIIGNLPKGKLDPRTAYQTAKDVNTPQCEGILISCTNWRTFKIISELEKDINKPVITSNQATLWKALKLTGVSKPNLNLGRLMETQ